MIAEFDWWLLIVGLVAGAGLAWLVLAESRRHDAEIDEAELASEAVWLAEAMADHGDPIAVETADRALRLHRAYLASMPPDEPDPEADDDRSHVSVDDDTLMEGDGPEAETPIGDIR
jgi:hypothetical protein